MRRSVAFVLGTLTGTSLLVGAKLGTHAPDSSGDSGAAATLAGGVTVAGASAAATPTTSRSSPAGGHPTSADGGPSAKPRTTAPKQTPKQTPKPTATTTSSGPKDGSYRASARVAGGRYGTLSMTVTITGHKITNIAASEADPTESNCYHSACPKLKSEALSAQSASIAAVSGATYTSQAYRSALQAVLSTAKG